MNNYEITQLSYEEALEKFQGPHQHPTKGDIVLSDGYNGQSDPKQDEKFSGQHWIIICRVLSIDEENGKVKVEAIIKLFEKGGSFPEVGVSEIPLDYLGKSTKEHIQEFKDLGITE